MTPHHPNHQDTHSIPTSKRTSVKNTPKIHVRYKFNHDDNWNEAKLINRATKATGKYANCWNVKSTDASEKFINFDKIHQLQILNKNSTNSDNLEHETNLVNIPYNTENERCQEPELVKQQIPEENIVDKILPSQNKEQEFQAKLIKLDRLKVRRVYDEVDDKGQESISLT